MKKILLLGLLCSVSVSSMAALLRDDERYAVLEKPEVQDQSKLQLELRLDFLAGTRTQNRLEGKEQYLTHEKKKLAFDSGAAVKVVYTNTMDDFSYGGVAVLTPTARISTSASFNGSYIFLTTENGTFKMGSPNDAGSELRVTGDKKTISSNWSDFITLNSKHMKYKGIAPEFETGNKWYTSSYKIVNDQYNDGTEFARKISFVTPEVKEGLRFGISYTPDSRNTGGSSFKNTKKTFATGIRKIEIAKNQTLRINENVKDAVAVGVNYRHVFSETTALEMGATGEFAKASGRGALIQDYDTPNAKLLKTYKVSNLKAYNVGVLLDVCNFSYALSYGTLGKSLTMPGYNKTGRQTHYFDAGIVYEQGPFKSSIEYFKSIKFKNNLDVVTLGTEYKLAPGLTPFVAFSHAMAKGRPSYYPEAKKQKLKASTLVLGVKLKILY